MFQDIPRPGQLSTENAWTSEAGQNNTYLGSPEHPAMPAKLTG